MNLCLGVLELTSSVPTNVAILENKKEFGHQADVEQDQYSKLIQIHDRCKKQLQNWTCDYLKITMAETAQRVDILYNSKPVLLWEYLLAAWNKVTCESQLPTRKLAFAMGEVLFGNFNKQMH